MKILRAYLWDLKTAFWINLFWAATRSDWSAAFATLSFIIRCRRPQTSDLGDRLFAIVSSRRPPATCGPWSAHSRHLAKTNASIVSPAFRYSKEEAVTAPQTKGVVDKLLRGRKDKQRAHMGRRLKYKEMVSAPSLNDRFLFRGNQRTG